MAKIKSFLLSGIKAPFDAPEEELLQIARNKVKHARITSAAGLHFQLYKKSIDARSRESILQVATVLVTADEAFEVKEESLARLGARSFEESTPSVVRGTAPMGGRPLVVGMGPAGLFAALLLAENGYAPILIDRGDGVEARAAAVERFRRFGVLDTESNVQFGAGGAGTFSDGKLVTRVNDPFGNYVLSRLCAFGAPREIMTKAKPHVGTDILRVVVDNILSFLQECGGTVLYRTRLEDFEETPFGVRARTSAGELEVGALLLAVGHSARDTFRMLMEKGMAIEVKPFSVGVRIEHLREDIDGALYGKHAGHAALGPAEYTLSDTKGERGVYTFCMCPGGEVVAAASEEEGLVVNGMSYHKRDGRNSNAAIAVSVLPSDVGGTAEGAIAFQRKMEHAAYLAGGGGYVAPVQTVGDFLAGKSGTAPLRVLPTYGGGRVKEADLRRVLPSFVTDALTCGLGSFGRRIKGFDAPDAVLTGAETRTSSPIRILRGEDRVATGFSRLYPVGEGAGYAGGITSAALDGLRSALALIARYAPPDKNSD